MAGGSKGSPNYVKILGKEGKDKIFGKTARYRLKKGEVARLVTGTGGGYGYPRERELERIASDLRNGYLTVEQARKDYGVKIDPETL